MKKLSTYAVLVLSYFTVFAIMLSSAHIYEMGVDAAIADSPVSNRTCIVIDAGHGGVDGGATSCTGVLESKINLDIAIRFNDLIHFLGFDTVMIRTGDYSVYTQEGSISQKKVSDLKHRVQIANSTLNAFLVSIHQNYYPDSRYFGPQIFYANTPASISAAGSLQTAFNQTLTKGCNRKQTQATGIYLMEKISCDGVLVECGFLSNPEEEARLLTPDYQKRICCVLASVLANHFHSKQLS